MNEVGSERIPVYAVSSSTLGGSRALSEFQEAVHNVFSAVPRGVSAQDYRLDMYAAHLGAVLLTEVDSSAQSFERGRPMVAQSAIDHFLVQLYLNGGYAGLADDADIRVRAGDICIFDLSRTLRTEAAEYRNITLVVPRPMLEARVSDPDGLHGLVLERELPLTSMLAAHIKTLVLHAKDLSLSDAEVAGRATVALIASLIETYANRGRQRPTASSPLCQVRHYINTHLHDPELGVTHLTEVFALSRAALYRMFEPEGGVARLIRVRRLRAAAIELSSPGGRQRRISQVARAWGFTDNSSFSRAFRAHFGISPSDARSCSAGMWAHKQGGHAGFDAPELAYWLRTLQN